MVEILKKQTLLQEEIIEKNYDKTSFINFCLSKKDNGDDLNEWSFEELKKVVSEYIEKENGIFKGGQKLEGNKKYKEIENEKLNIPTNTIRILFPRTYYLSGKNIYLILNLGNTQKILKQDLLKFDWTLSPKEFTNIYKSNISVSLYEHNMLLMDKFKGSFSINLSSIRYKCVSEQKYEINLENKKKDEFAEVILRVRYPCEKLQVVSEKININAQNNEKAKENILYIVRLNKDINDLKNELNNKENIINDYKNEIQNLKKIINDYQNEIQNLKKIINDYKNEIQI